MKDKLLIIVGIIIFLGLCIGTLMYMDNKEDIYYTEIDNDKIKRLSLNEDMKYEYTLLCYDESGDEKSLSFKTSRELRNNAFLKLEVHSLGVHSWAEVTYDELPDKVKEKYENKE